MSSVAGRVFPLGFSQMTVLKISAAARRLADWIAPAVCDWCDEGSGTRRDPATGRIERCPVCGGSGQAATSKRRGANGERH